MMEACDLAKLYESMLTPSCTVRNSPEPSAKVPCSHQISQIDALWVELGYCVDRWRSYDAQFIATRFANMHYVPAPKIGNAIIDDDVWAYLVAKIRDLQTYKKVTISYATFTRGEVHVWT